MWLAEDRELRQLVAIKVFRENLSKAARERLRREVILGRELTHPGLVRTYELIDAGGCLAVAMEFIRGGSVAALLAAGPLPIDRVIAVARHNLAVLAYLHAQGVVHRDVKPSNLLLDDEGGVRLADLGLARHVEGDATVTRTHLAVGTTRYMSPEQLRGERATPASDLYSLGVTLFELVTGKPPFEADSEFEVARLHMQVTPPDPQRARRDCPRWLARFVVRLMQKSPRDRFADAEEALAAFERRRVVMAPRTRRRLAWAGLVAGAVAIASAIVVQVAPASWRLVATATVVAEGKTVRGVDRRGRTTWEIALGSTIHQLAKVDLDGDGAVETVVCASETSMDRSLPPRKSEVVAVTTRGEVLTRRHPEDLLTEWPYEYPKLLTPFVEPLDLDGDGGYELVVRGNQRGFYPAAILVFWPREALWEAVSFHSGHIYDVRLVAAGRRARLRMAAVNNRLGAFPVVGEFMLTAPGARAGPTEVALQSSPELRGDPDFWSWYTLLPEGGDGRLVVEAGGDTLVTREGTTTRLDRWGNPTPGPNAGKDLRAQRLAFLRLLHSLDQDSQPTERSGVLARLERGRVEVAALLEEEPYRAMLSLAAARALARVGDLEGATTLLRRAHEEVPLDEVTYRLAHLLALGGRLGEAASLVEALSASPRTPRFQYDGVQMVLRLAIERRDREAFRRVVRRMTNASMAATEENARVQAALWARAHLFWDEPSEADAQVRSWLLVPDGDAIAGLVRWRLGRVTADDALRMQRAIEDNPDAAMEGRLALAAVQSSLGHHREALATLGASLAALEPASSDDFMNKQLLDLAQAVRAKLLLAAGDGAAARREALRLQPALRPGLVPAVLVGEVLRATSTAVGAPLPAPARRPSLAR